MYCHCRMCVLLRPQALAMQVLISSSSELQYIKDAYSSAVNSYFEQNHWMSQGTVRILTQPHGLHSPPSQIKETYKAMMQIEGSIVRSSSSRFFV